MRVQLHSESEREKIQAEVQTLGKQLGENTKKEKKKFLKLPLVKFVSPKERPLWKSKRKYVMDGWKNLNVINRRIYLVLHNLINR